MKEHGEAVVTTAESTFVRSALAEGLRVDGRSPYDYRTLRIARLPTRALHPSGKPSSCATSASSSSASSSSSAHGHHPHKQLPLEAAACASGVEVQLGRTRVSVRISAEIVRPFPDRPTEGMYLFHTELSPMASPYFENASRVSIQSVEIGRIVERGLRDSHAIDCESLCIIAGEHVWSIRVDMTVLDDGGNLVDACALAAITALHGFRKPQTRITDGRLIVHRLDEQEPAPLSVHHIPVSVTIAFFADPNDTDAPVMFAVDPSWKEEQVMDGSMTITLNAFREICAVQKAGGVPISVKTLLECNRVAAVKAKELLQVVKRALGEDEKPPVLFHPAPVTAVPELDVVSDDATITKTPSIVNFLERERAEQDRLGTGGASAWDDQDDEDQSTSSHHKQTVGDARRRDVMEVDNDSDNEDDSDDSEEEEVHMLDAQ